MTIQAMAAGNTRGPETRHHHSNQKEETMNDIQQTPMTEEQIQQLVDRQREYFRTGATLSVEFRRQQLEKLDRLLREHLDELYEAIYNDFGKSKHHTQLTETFPLFEELELAIKNLDKWMKPRKVATNLLNQPAKSYIVPEPLGVTLVIGAWNFPYNLSLTPVVGSMVAGNTTVLKPSELPAETSRVMAKIINENFDPRYLQVVEGGIPETTSLEPALGQDLLHRQPPGWPHRQPSGSSSPDERHAGAGRQESRNLR
ncbi:MAG: aldehyde dehydrogenase family protein [Acidobacteriota bacterium]